MNHAMLVEFGGAGRFDPPAILENRDPVTNLEHVFDKMTDKNDGYAARLELGQQREQAASFRRAERAGRFVQNQDPRSAVKSAGDFHHLPDDKRKSIEPARDVDVDFHFLQKPTGLVVHCPPVDVSQASCRLAPQKQVLGYRELADP